MFRRLLYFGMASFLLLACGAMALVIMVPSDPEQQAALARSLLDLDEFQTLVRIGVLDGLKQEYVDQHHWGQQAEARPRVELRGNLLHPRLEKTDEAVNDGLWQRFVITLVDPADNLQTRVEDVTATPDGRFAFSFWMRARVQGQGQFQRWAKGVRLLDTSGDFAADTALRVHCALGVRREPAALVDDVVLDPQVTNIEIQLLDLDLERIGRVGHDVSRELGNLLKPAIEREIAHREPHFVDKANQSIHRHPERLRISVDTFLASGWAKLQASVAGDNPSEGQR